MEQEFECSICHDISRNPLLLECSHIFCFDCMNKYKNSHDSKDLLCPVCRQQIDLEDEGLEQYLVKDNLFVQRILNKLNVDCKTCNKWKGTYEELAKHESVCPYVLEKCECKILFPRILLADHKLECNSVTMNCMYCDKSIRRREFESHIIDSCPLYPISCDNKDCKWEGIRKNLSLHKKNDCLKQIVNCKYKVFNCDYKNEREKINIHEIECEKKLQIKHCFLWPNWLQVGNIVLIKRQPCEIKSIIFSTHNIDITYKTLENTNEINKIQLSRFEYLSELGNQNSDFPLEQFT